MTSWLRGVLSIQPRSKQRVVIATPTAPAMWRRRSVQSRQSRQKWRRLEGSGGSSINFSSRDWARVLRRSKLQRIRFHDLRHTYASLLIAQGAHPKYIQVQLGHASIQTTLDRYGHLMPEMHEAEARKLDRLVFGTTAQDGVTRVPADASQRSQIGHAHEEGASGTDRSPLIPAMVAGARNHLQADRPLEFRFEIVV